MSYAKNSELSYDLKGFLSVFGTFAHKVAQTWFVLPETWQTKLFVIYYCVEVVIIVNHSHARNYVLSCNFKGF